MAFYWKKTLKKIINYIYLNFDDRTSGSQLYIKKQQFISLQTELSNSVNFKTAD